MAGVVRADWHLGDLDLPSEPEPLNVAHGAVIDLSGTEAEITAELRELADREAQTAKVWGTQCDLKWKPEHRLMGGTKTSCFTCPHFTEDEAQTMSLVCALGREQELTNARLESLQDDHTLDDELVDAYLAEADAADELVAAYL